MAEHPFALRFVVAIGKGGVGKSAVSAALALMLAREGRRVLVAMCNAKERLSYLLETDPVGPQIRNVAPNIDAVNMEPGAALEEYGMMVLRVRALYKLIFENRFVSAFLRGTPGLEAWAMLGKAQYHAFETLPDGRPRYDTVIVDAPATGHGLDLLRVPHVILDVVPPGPLRKDAERAWEMFSDPRQAGVLVVTLPEEMPTNETLELYQAVTEELGLPVCGLAANMVLPRLFSDEEAALLQELDTGDEPALSAMARASRERASREQIQAECLHRLSRDMPVPSVKLPLLFTHDLRREGVEALSQALKTGR
ncbi:MAG: ArsA family ATPase [Myxococcales bacterium]|jgi:anion-transporting  ArsA/GET3 family ATPase